MLTPRDGMRRTPMAGRLSADAIAADNGRPPPLVQDRRRATMADRLALYGLHRGSGIEPDTLARRARRAEDAGFESLWVGDHTAVPPGPQVPRLEALVALTSLAAVTSRVRLGVGLIVLPRALWAGATTFTGRFGRRSCAGTGSRPGSPATTAWSCAGRTRDEFRRPARSARPWTLSPGASPRVTAPRSRTSRPARVRRSSSSAA